MAINRPRQARPRQPRVWSAPFHFVQVYFILFFFSWFKWLGTLAEKSACLFGEKNCANFLILDVQKSRLTTCPDWCSDSPLPRYHNVKLVVIFTMGVVTTLYSLTEIVIALRYASLVMLTDGLHNFSDAGALAVGFWAENKKLKVSTISLFELVRSPLV